MKVAYERARANMRRFDFDSVTERLPTTSFEQRSTAMRIARVEHQGQIRNLKTGGT